MYIIILYVQHVHAHVHVVVLNTNDETPPFYSHKAQRFLYELYAVHRSDYGELGFIRRAVLHVHTLCDVTSLHVAHHNNIKMHNQVCVQHIICSR